MRGKRQRSEKRNKCRPKKCRKFYIWAGPPRVGLGVDFIKGRIAFDLEKEEGGGGGKL